MVQVTVIQSCYRMIKQEHNPDRGGNLMMAVLPQTETQHGLQIAIKFIGSHRSAQTDFKIDRPKPGANTFSIELHDNLYYLCAERDKVFLQKLVAQQPKDEKYLFEVKYVNESSGYMSMKSKNTGKYLASDDSGKAFMEEVKHSSLFDGQPMDRRTWFNLVFVETVKRERESTLHSCNFNDTSLEYSVRYQTQVKAC
ncbi:uncharacterized protein LOC111339898 [Stylophora pistillata]|uniref:Uncharacterized protein n=1 Tax=Stylophora pistillata TaxID=50429 RepID=A0A2B4RNR2_STYPI|nr:uncharacterized protein LOC111339898 [Stylophora pistillata]PFX18170.1 hypothetical protein AWC38_SpisGene17465 [Stylophora pistillata]